MIINFSPSRGGILPVLERCGDVILVDGMAFDFAPIPEGGILPAEAINSDWICGDVMRKDGVLHLTLKLSLGVDAPDSARFPAPITLTQDGPITLPCQTSNTA